MKDALPLYSLALGAFSLLVCSIKGHNGPLRVFIIGWLGALLVGCLIVVLGFASGFVFDSSGPAWLSLWGGMLLVYLAYWLLFLVILFWPQSPKAKPVRGRNRAICTILGICILSASLVGINRKALSVQLMRATVTTNAPLPYLDDAASLLNPHILPWKSLSQLSPSPQKEKLTAMLGLGVPPAAFWTELLTLPPSPQRTAVLQAFAHAAALSEVPVLTLLHDQGDMAGRDALLAEAAQNFLAMDTLIRTNTENGRIDILRLLLPRADRRAAQSALDAAISHNDMSMARLALDRGVTPVALCSALSNAAYRNRPAIARLLLEQGHDPNCRCPLIAALQHPEMMSLLLEYGADPNCRDSDGASPLHWAARHLYPESVRFLLKAGADTQLTAADGRTALEWAGDSAKYAGSTENYAKRHAEVRSLLGNQAPEGTP